jgi:hypothetical protein
MKFEFTNLHFEGEIRTKWDTLLRIVGDFTLRIRDRAIYTEVDFCLVEFAVALANWLAIATDLGPDFIYTSLESDIEGLVRFTRIDRGVWQISAAHEDHEARDTFTTADLKSAALAYIRELRSQLPSSVDILQFVDDADARQLLEG